MTDELRFGATHDKAKLAVLREAVERADVLASSLSRLIETQGELIALQKERIRQLESLLSEYRSNF